jgi:hypothetical protein
MALFIPDANILINALRKGAPYHQECAQWLRDTGTNGAEIGLTELVEAAYLRIATLPRIQVAPINHVLQFWREDLWSHPRVRRLQPRPSHNAILGSLIEQLALTGNDINDAWLAALAIEYRATLVSLDRGFARFPGLDWLDPSAT